MRSIQQQIRTRLVATQSRKTNALPPWLRNILRMVSGGDNLTSQFVRGLLWQYRWLVVISLLAGLGTAAAETLTLGVFTMALNEVSAMMTNSNVAVSGRINSLLLQSAAWLGGSEPIVPLIIIAVCLQLLRSALDYASQATAVVLRVWAEADMQRRIFSQLMRIRYQQIISSRLGDLATYNALVSEVGIIIQYISQGFNDSALTLAYIAVLFWLSWQFTLFAIVVVVLFSTIFGRVRQSIRQSVRSYLAIIIRTNEHILEYLQGIRLVHIFARETEVIREVNGLINSGIPLRRISLQRRALISPLFQSIAIIAIAIFLVVGLWAINTSKILSAAELVAYLFVVYRMMPRISSLNNQLGQAAGQWPYISRVAKLLDSSDKEMEYTPARTIEQFRERIDFRGVNLHYPQAEREALKSLSLSIPAGKMVALVGPSGSGKSSIINLLLGLYRPTAGQILVDGIDLQKWNLASWRRLIGVVDQDTLIFSSSIADNIRFGKPDATDEEVIAAAKVANADEFIRNLPQGYQTEVGDRGHRLSGGQRQRIAIARAIVKQPSLLFFDEATSALDSHTERLIQESLEELRKERTLVVIAHRLSTIVNADRIILIDSGQIIEEGTHQELLALDGRYAAMWKLQADIH